MSATIFSRNKILDNMYGSVSYSPPSSWFVSLSTTPISSSGSNLNEPTGANYSRVEVVNSKGNFTMAASGSLVNSSAIVFPQSSGSWGTITSIALMDSVSSGSCWFFTDLSSPRVVQDLSVISFSASAIIFSVT